MVQLPEHWYLMVLAWLGGVIVLWWILTALFNWQARRNLWKAAQPYYGMPYHAARPARPNIRLVKP